MCNQCDNPLCVWTCPTGASYKRSSDGIVLWTLISVLGVKLVWKYALCMQETLVI
ncbi:hypothetical protein DESAMIL20_1824 [Desulfurella amilsii]|uniref:4Fe-4S ferredoxin-type domain-containing protein n=1 Tax=Desulfurella amilsii TaxID=1562698 RepID=A0A1X4XXK8_9BACT|nr:hypothetical protein DESAMIL20_1824 [Desulfurella amilsii]